MRWPWFVRSLVADCCLSLLLWLMVMWCGLACCGSVIESKTGHVSSLAVSDEYRRQGIGRELMDLLHLQVRGGGEDVTWLGILYFVRWREEGIIPASVMMGS
jgi:ribosomal protein S18 acetylase RimI-like enzyme